MGSCTSRPKRLQRFKNGIVLEEFFDNRKTAFEFTNPEVRLQIFSSKDSKAPLLHLELNELRNRRLYSNNKLV